MLGIHQAGPPVQGVHRVTHFDSLLVNASNHENVIAASRPRSAEAVVAAATQEHIERSDREQESELEIGEHDPVVGEKTAGNIGQQGERSEGKR